ncbi:MAG: DUF4347 domain-containing protein [Planktothrix sp.]|uniref:DUF4347 domain-containing protein n=1 Tax=Planktothrix sp. TaxID=3088171 RepID=UPI0038D4BF7B
MEIWHSPDHSALSGITAAASSATAYLGGTGQEHFSTIGQNSKSSNIAFIDSNIDDYQDLVKGLQPNTEIWVLDPLQDEVTQITQVLSGLSDIKSLSIFSHGSDGHLQLGSTDLNLNNLGNYADALTNWRGALTEDADILLYGCNVAASQAGQDFVQQIDQLTGADVAASKDLTGSASVGGNWNLEFSTGALETPNILQSWAQDGYNHTLATFSVTNTNDSGAGSLRQAILDANAAAGADTINFTETMADTTPDTITLTTGQLVISDDLTITGPGANLLTINGNNASRVFAIQKVVNNALVSATVNITGVTIDKGFAGSNAGAGIFNNGSVLTLSKSTLTNNVAQQGGAILNAGSILVTDSTFSNNQAKQFGTNAATRLGGAIYNITGAALTVGNSTFDANSSSQLGGAIYNNAGSMLVNGGTFSNNSALQGGALYNASSSVANSSLPLVNVVNSKFNSNVAQQIGAGIFNVGNMLVNGGTFDSNKATSSGGGIYNAKTGAALNSGVLEARNSTFNTNQAISGDGGGIYNATGTTLTSDNNIFSKNTTGRNGGGIYNAGGASVTVTTNLINNGTAATSGGGIANFGTIVSMDNTLIQGNQATSSSGAGGAVFNAGTANITNTTIKSNSTAGQGGGIYNGNNATTGTFGTLTLRNNSLVSGNRAASGGGIYNATNATAKVGGSTMISNRLTSSSGVGPDAWGNYISEGFNTIYKTAGSTGFSAANGDTIIFG